MLLIYCILNCFFRIFIYAVLICKTRKTYEKNSVQTKKEIDGSSVGNVTILPLCV